MCLHCKRVMNANEKPGDAWRLRNVTHTQTAEHSKKRRNANIITGISKLRLIKKTVCVGASRESPRIDSY